MAAARGGDDGEIGRQQCLGLKAVEGGQQHPLRQIAGRSEKHQRI